MFPRGPSPPTPRPRDHDRPDVPRGPQRDETRQPDRVPERDPALRRGPGRLRATSRAYRSRGFSRGGDAETMSALDLVLSYLTQPFIQRAFVVGILVALLSSFLIVFIFIKNVSLIGDGLAHTQ